MTLLPLVVPVRKSADGNDIAFASEFGRQALHVAELHFEPLVSNLRGPNLFQPPSPSTGPFIGCPLFTGLTSAFSVMYTRPSPCGNEMVATLRLRVSLGFLGWRVANE